MAKKEKIEQVQNNNKPTKLDKFKSLFKKQVKERTYHKMYMYFVVVNYSFSDSVIKILKEEGSNCQIACLGRGTANKEVMNMLGLENNSKGVIVAFVDETNVKNIKKALNKNFNENKKFMGIAFTIPLTSIIGEKLYCFLTNSL